MPDPRAFISFDFDHNENARLLFVGQARNSRTPFNIQDWSSKTALSQSRWQEIIADKIGRCHMLIVLVGRNMSTATGVHKEIAMAQARNIPIFGIYVDGAGAASPLPPGLQRNRTIPWEWEKIASAVRQMMTEGCNA